MDVYAAIEAGGTKWVCMLAESPSNVIAEQRIATTSPEETLKLAIDFFRFHSTKHNLNIKRMGIGSFGPLDLNPNSPAYGQITSTPKPGWQFVDIVQPFIESFNIPVNIDTDVNAAAIGEGKWGAAQGLTDFIYLTIGTGIGGGALVNGHPVHGLVHPEMGHIPLVTLPEDPYSGFCPYHGTCFEGLAAGPAIKLRWGKSAEELPPDHPAWRMEAYYIGQALWNLIVTYSPQRIILGGGVMQQSHLFPLIRQETLTQLANYVVTPIITEHIDTYIVPPLLGQKAGLMGALALAMFE